MEFIQIAELEVRVLETLDERSSAEVAIASRIYKTFELISRKAEAIKADPVGRIAKSVYHELKPCSRITVYIN